MTVEDRLPYADPRRELRRVFLILTGVLWLFCFCAFFASTFLWTRWAPPAWLLAFNFGACLSGAAVSLMMAGTLARACRWPSARRWALGLALAIGAALVQAFIDQQLWRELAHAFMAPQPRAATVPALFADFGQKLSEPIGAMRLVTYLWLFALYAAAVELVLKNHTLRRRERQLLEAQRMIQRAELAVLRFQLDPHFLFNVLNSISSLITLGRGEEAGRMMDQFSDLMRSTLKIDPEGSLTVAEEFDLIDQYLQIEAIRFGDRLSVDFDCPEDLGDALAPSLILQPLADNAVKYGVGRTRGPVKVSVSARREGSDLVLEVENTVSEQTAAGAAIGTGTGLANVRGRLSRLFGERGRLTTERRTSSHIARLTLPLAFTGAAAATA